MVDKPPLPTLAELVEDSKKEWHGFIENYKNTPGDMNEYMIYNINACESRYVQLLKQARKMNITAWTICKDGYYTGPPGPPVESKDPICKRLLKWLNSSRTR